jgi:hypothetical protein
MLLLFPGSVRKWLNLTIRKGYGKNIKLPRTSGSVRFTSLLVDYGKRSISASNRRYWPHAFGAGLMGWTSQAASSDFHF